MSLSDNVIAYTALAIIVAVSYLFIKSGSRPKVTKKEPTMWTEKVIQFYQDPKPKDKLLEPEKSPEKPKLRVIQGGKRSK